MLTNAQMWITERRCLCLCLAVTSFFGLFHLLGFAPFCLHPNIKMSDDRVQVFSVILGSLLVSLLHNRPESLHFIVADV